MAVVIFALGIKATNGLVKSTINTANSLVKFGIDTSIVNIVGKFGGLDYLDPAFPLDKRVKKYSLDALELHGNDDIKLRNSLFYKEEQKFLTASYTMYHKKALQEINNRLDENDLIIFVHPLAMKIYVEANPNSKVKKIIQVHGNYIEEIDNYNLLKKDFDKIDYIQTVSRYMRDDLVEILGAPKEKTIYIPNIAVPANVIKKKEKYLKKVSIIGSIQKRKNQYDAVRMLEYIEDNNVVLQVFGHELDKEYTAFIKEYIERKGLTHRVFFKSVASEEEIYSNTDLVVLTSEHEGLPYIFQESAMYNIPVVAYDFKYGAKEFLRDGENGCLIEMGDYKSMAKKVSEILEDEALYKKIVEDNSKFFDEAYAEEKTVEKYIDFLGDKNKKFDINDLIKNENDATLVFSNIKRSNEVVEVVNDRWIVNGKPEVKKSEFFVFKVDVKGDIENIKIFYYYKKKKLSAEDIKMVRENKRNFLFSQVNSNKNQKIEFKIPKKNKFSNGNIISKFFIVAEDKKGKEHYIGYIDKKGNFELISNLKKHYPIKTGSTYISELEHILKPNGLYIRYPNNETISQIIDENGEDLKFETAYLRYYGEYIPFFKVTSGIYDNINIILNSKQSLQIKFKYNSYKSLFVKLEEIERKYSLYDITIDNIYFWELIRASLFETILENIGVLNKHFTKKSTSNKKESIHVKKSLWDIPDCDKLIFEFPRKNEIDYRTLALQKEFPEAMVLEYPQEYGYSDKVYELESNIYPIEEYLNHYKEYKAIINLSSYDKERIKWLKKVFKNEIGLNIEFSQFIDERIKKYKKEFSFFDQFFKEKDIQEILIPSSYWSAGIIAAAKKNNIVASDIQYALISKYHPSFAFLENYRNYNANRIYLWSKYWNIKEVPFDKSIVKSNNYFKEKCEAMHIMPNMENKYDIAFVSQSRIGEKILAFAYKFAKKNRKKSIIFCPHPDEDLVSYENYDKFINLKNVKISYNETLKDIADSQTIITVYSTTAFEALALEKNVFILKINGYEILEKEISKKFIRIISNIQELENSLKHTHIISKDYTKLFYNFTFKKDKCVNL